MRTLVVRAVSVIVLAAAAAGVAPAAPRLTLRYPSGAVPDAGALAAAIQDPSVGTIVFERGTNPFSSPITVFRRRNLTLRGATGRAADVVIESTSVVAVSVEESSGITIRGLTIRSTATAGEGVRLQAVRSSSVAGFAHDVTLRHCRIEGFVPVRGTVRARALDVADCRIDVTRAGGAGILWEDGPALLVTRTRFTTSAPGPAVGAVVVRGALVAESEGDRARGVLLTRNRVSGDFQTAFDLSDIVDARIQRNVIEYVSPAFTDPGGDGGRAGIVIRRVSAAAPTEDFELRGNRVRGAHTALWFVGTGEGKVIGNDLRRSGRASADARFGDTGCAIRIGLFGPVCRLTVSSNDLRDLRSPAPQPASLVTPESSAASCFPAGTRNRVNKGRTVYQR